MLTQHHYYYSCYWSVGVCLSLWTVEGRRDTVNFQFTQRQKKETPHWWVGRGISTTNTSLNSLTICSMYSGVPEHTWMTPPTSFISVLHRKYFLRKNRSERSLSTQSVYLSSISFCRHRRVVPVGLFVVVAFQSNRSCSTDLQLDSWAQIKVVLGNEQ